MTRPAARPLRIACLALQDGAHGEYGALMAAAMARAGGAAVEMLVIAPRALTESGRARAPLAEVQQVRAVAMGSAAQKLRALPAVLGALRAFRPDVIHDPVGSGVAALLPLRPLLPRLAPLVVTEHNPEVHPGMTGRHHRPARALTRRGAALIHVHGPAAFADMRRLGVAEERLVMIRHGAADEYGAAAARFDREPGRILVFGALRPNKGIDMLPAILRRVRARHPQATLLVAGRRPPHLDPAGGAALDAGLAELAAMPGCEIRNAHIPEAEIPELFGRCGICLLPYRSATQSGVATIAMTTGASLVASRVGDIPDIVTHGRTGLLATPEPAALADQVIAALDDPAATAARAEAARRFAARDCAWPVIGAQMLEACRRLRDRAR